MLGGSNELPIPFEDLVYHGLRTYIYMYMVISIHYDIDL